jgi:hypothetical protein
MISWCGCGRLLEALLLQLQTLLHAEAVLLIDDRQREIAELDAFLEQRMRADDQPHLARSDDLERAAARARRL